jgi:hypothetical protein
MTRGLVAFLLILAAVLLFVHHRSDTHPLLIDAKAPVAQTCPSWFVQHPCALKRCGAPETKTA